MSISEVTSQSRPRDQMVNNILVGGEKMSFQQSQFALI